MNQISEFQDHCNLCGASSPKRILTLREEGRFLERCTQCGLVFLNAEERMRLNRSHEEREIEKDMSPAFRESYTRFFEQFFQELPIKAGRVLDVGCGPGLFLSVARKHGWEVQGIDNSRKSVESAHSVYGLSIAQGK
ncbi:MAG: methyltransferase domain-containing protein, partial [Candidatus Omnitrophota bacterium]